MSETNMKYRREELRRQLADCREKSAGRSAEHLRAAWFSVSALTLAAISLFLFAEGLEKLWGAAFLFAALAVTVWRAVRYVRIERELRRIAKELARLENGDPAPSRGQVRPETTPRPTGKTAHRIV